MKNFFSPFLFSALIHSCALLISFFITEVVNTVPPFQGSSLQFQVINSFPIQPAQSQEKNIDDAQEEKEKEEKPDNEPAFSQEVKSFNDNINKADTSSLNQIYSESSLNVKIKYPLGWTYIDQNVKKRLDGVTFWGTSDGSNPPPYVHLEVQEKYLFNPSKYKNKSEMKNAELYFNKPEELEDQFTQIVYIRTKEEFDYQIKLIVNGKQRFNQYLPIFFSMIKSFKFGYLF